MLEPVDLDSYNPLHDLTTWASNFLIGVSVHLSVFRPNKQFYLISSDTAMWLALVVSGTLYLILNSLTCNPADRYS